MTFAGRTPGTPENRHRPASRRAWLWGVLGLALALAGAGGLRAAQAEPTASPKAAAATRTPASRPAAPPTATTAPSTGERRPESKESKESKPTPMTPLPGNAGTPDPAAPAPATADRRPAAAPDLDAVLAAALRGLPTTGHLSVAVADPDRHRTAVYAPGGHAFVTASIVKVDILATLLLQSQDAGRPLTAEDTAHAVKMIEASDNAAADALWARIGSGAGLGAANRRFGLTHTVPGPGGQWGLTTTTAADQVRLLSRLTAADSPLDAASRSYLLGLMEHVEPDQAWGVPAAAAPATVPAVKNGWLPRDATGLWVINSIGVVRPVTGGRHYLVAVLSDDQPSDRAGIQLVQSAVRTALTALR